MINVDNSQVGSTERHAENDERLIRFRKAYFRMTKKQRMEAQSHFLQIHGIGAQTFRTRLSGGSTISETECEWMEKYDPYSQPVAV